MISTNDTIMLTIDSSTKKTGICVWKNGTYLTHHLIDHEKEKCMKDRYPLMCQDLITILETYKPNILYIEDEVVTRNMDTCRFLFRLQGIIEGWCIVHNCEFNTVRPSQWRKACNFKQGQGQKRKELKEQSISFVKKKLNKDVTDDEADSICIGYYVLDLFQLI